VSITLDGTTKTVKLTQDQIDAIKAARDDTTGVSGDAEDLFVQYLNDNIDAIPAFYGKLTVSNVSETDGEIALNFALTADAGTDSNFKVTSDAGDAIGISGSLTNYVDTSNTLSQLLGDLSSYEKADATDDDGNQLYTVTIGGATVNVSETTTLKELMEQVNSDENSKIKITYSQTTKKFAFTAQETGTSGNDITLDANDLVKDLFGITDDTEMSGGANAKFTVNINGDEMYIERASNTVDLDGLSVTLKGTFNESYDVNDANRVLDPDEVVSFNVSADTDTIISAIRDMVNDYNTMASAIKEAYSTMPLQKSDGSSYEPLSDDDMADMSDTAIERYETNAKTGLLFGDSDLSSFYSGLLNAISSSTAGSKVFSEIGISTSYSDGMTTLELNETKLKEALESDPDKVRDAFVGDNGLMQGLSNTLDTYVKTTGASKGILIEKAGSTLAPTSIYNNTWQSKIDDLDDEIEKWQDKLSDKIDYYTTQFTNLETLISEMNSQSSMLSSLSSSY
jgi:flagellar hook-associated protein 2